MLLISVRMGFFSFSIYKLKSENSSQPQWCLEETKLDYFVISQGKALKKEDHLQRRRNEEVVAS